MLEIAKGKAIKEQLDIKFIKGDMRTTRAGKFDAVITIFNSIGHLTKEDFIKTIKNIYSNLNDGGLYIFDIFNLNYLLKDNNITKLTIDWLKRCGDIIVREIQYSTISSDGILASYDIYHQQKLESNPNITHDFQTLQVYTAKQLKIILEKNGFELLKQYNIDGKSFDENKTERILTIAQKK
ncbi:class I SAM-dependent methyltransferase [Candidatus Aquarickettsia rohweri]|uniref:Class I SAM-dependent methyltransferase n=1 Tax=Candidatus Aquarickettsia rohweri TaxID=2602574 RepID=A0A429XER3_9RICK|nr:class I SAM-dependent methyltransferase [Candidatus Aquarickettsia rohweri]